MDNNPLNLKVKDGKLYQKGKRTSIGEVLLKFLAGMSLLGLVFLYIIWESLNTIIMMIVEPWENWARESSSYKGLYHMNEASDFDWSQGDWYFIYPILVGIIILVLCYFLLTLKSKYILIRLIGKLFAFIIFGFGMMGWYIMWDGEIYKLIVWFNS